MRCSVYSCAIMEALKTGARMSNWNDDRLDELNRRTDSGFAKVDQRFDRVERAMKDGFAKADERFSRIEDALGQTPTRVEMDKAIGEIRGALLSLHRTLIAGAIAIVLALIGFHG
jgi:hypothetical protein